MQRIRTSTALHVLRSASIIDICVARHMERQTAGKSYFIQAPCFAQLSVTATTNNIILYLI
jgi:hypothetical protein